MEALRSVKVLWPSPGVALQSPKWEVEGFRSTPVMPDVMPAGSPSSKMGKPKGLTAMASLTGVKFGARECSVCKALPNV